MIAIGNCVRITYRNHMLNDEFFEGQEYCVSMNSGFLIIEMYRPYEEKTNTCGIPLDLIERFAVSSKEVKRLEIKNEEEK